MPWDHMGRAGLTVEVAAITLFERNQEKSCLPSKGTKVELTSVEGPLGARPCAMCLMCRISLNPCVTDDTVGDKRVCVIHPCSVRIRTWYLSFRAYIPSNKSYTMTQNRKIKCNH